MLVSRQPSVMGIINLSPHSFYQALPTFSDALQKSIEMVAQGADIIDVGAVATNPKINNPAEILSVQQELDLVAPFVETLSKNSNVKISVDTSRAVVMEAVIKAGAHMINDQCALRGENALKTVATLQVPVCLMHHFNPARQPDSSTCAELLAQIKNDLQKDTARCMAAGIKKENIIIDPGFGGGNFGKSADENFYLLTYLNTFVDLSFPVLVGLSRKIMFAEIGPTADDRLFVSIAAAVIAAQKGAFIIRTHDVKETVDAMWVVQKTLDLRDKVA